MAHRVLPQPTATLAQGGCMFAFGLPFVATGVALAWIRLFRPEWIQYEGSPTPAAIIYGMAALFGGAGLLLWVPHAFAVAARLRQDRRAKQFPREPWRADRSWNSKGDRQRPVSDALGSLVFFAFMALFLAPFHWWMWAETWWPGVAIVALFDLFLLAGLAYWAYTVGRSLKYGAARIAYDQFPFFLGEPLGVSLMCRGGFERFDRLTVTVRFVKVKIESKDNRSDKVCHQHWAEERVFERALLAGVAELPLSFQLPEGDYDSRLGDDPPRYWEIEAKGEAPGIDFAAQFLLPIYARR